MVITCCIYEEQKVFSFQVFLNFKTGKIKLHMQDNYIDIDRVRSLINSFLQLSDSLIQISKIGVYSIFNLYTSKISFLKN